MTEAEDGFLIPSTLDSDNPPVDTPVIPPIPVLHTSASFHSNHSHSTSSTSRRRNWADVTDDSSGDEHWTPSSGAKPSEVDPSYEGVADLSDVPAEGGSSSSQSNKESIKANKKGHRIVSASVPAQASPAACDGSVAAPPHNLLMSSQLSELSQAEDERSWAEASSTAASTSGSERNYGREAPARPPAWSRGAVDHESGSCHPCIFYPKAVGCDNGEDCPFCHLHHEPKARHRRHMRRGRGNAEDGSESKEDVEDGEAKTSRRTRTDPEEVTFILPSALHRANHPWPILAPGDKQADETSGQDGTRRSRRGGLKTERRSSTSSSSSVNTNGQKANGQHSERAEADAANPASDVTSVFTSLLAPLFGSTSPSEAAALAGASEKPEAADVQSNGSEQGRGRRSKGYGKARPPKAGT